MRALLVDIGNTSMKLGVADAETVFASYTLPTEGAQSGDGLGFQIMRVLEHAGVPFRGKDARLAACLASSVVPRMDPLVRHACERYLGQIGRAHV